MKIAIGLEMAVCRNWGDELTRLTVTKTCKRYFVTDDGQKWDYDGCGYPLPRYGYGRRIQTVGDAARGRITKLSMRDIRDLSDSAALDILARWERDVAERDTQEKP